jgi:hypothetical protein
VLAVFLFGITSQAKATFIVDPDPGGAFFFMDKANKDVSTFTGQVGGKNTGLNVVVDAVGNVDTGAGYANIDPTKGTILSSLTFTPADDDLFSDFSFRAQLLVAGDVIITVVDDEGKTFTFSTNEVSTENDFKRIGIISKDGETIQSVTISATSFKQVKQIDFSGEGVINVPEPTTLLLFGLGLVGLAGIRRMRQ